MSESPRISIAIPLYNEELVVEELLEHCFLFNDIC